MKQHSWDEQTSKYIYGYPIEFEQLSDLCEKYSIERSEEDDDQAKAEEVFFAIREATGLWDMELMVGLLRHEDGAIGGTPVIAVQYYPSETFYSDQEIHRIAEAAELGPDAEPRWIIKYHGYDPDANIPDQPEVFAEEGAPARSEVEDLIDEQILEKLKQLRI